MNQSPPLQPAERRATVLRSAGVMILASLAAFGFWLWVLLQVLALYTELELHGWSVAGLIKGGDFWDQIRAIAAIVGAAVLTLGTWLIAMRFADDT